MNVEVYKKIFEDAWKIFVKYCRPVDQDLFWNNFISELGVFTKKHGSSEFVLSLALAISTEIEEWFVHQKRRQ